MQIISNFTDYYDSMLQYGMDKSLTFNRINKHQFKPNKTQEWQLKDSNQEQLPDNLKKYVRALFKPTESTYSDTDQYLFQAYRRNKIQPGSVFQAFQVDLVQAVINGKVFTSYMLFENVDVKTPGASSFESRYKIIKRNATAKELFDNIKKNSQYFDLKNSYNDGVLAISQCDTYEQFAKNKYKGSLFYEFESSEENEQNFLKIHKELSTPVFFIHSGKVYKDLPLSYFGLVNVFEGNMEKTYQEIAYCLANIVQNKNEPPVEISNLDKVQQYGFDKKISFRHRK